MKLYIMEVLYTSRLRSNTGLIKAINMEELLRIFKKKNDMTVLL